MKKTITALTAATIFFAAAPSYAQTIDDAGAAKLKTIMQEQIDYADKVYGNIPSLQLKHEGELAVTQHDGYYQVVLPEYALEMEHPSDAADKLMIYLGQIVMNVVPEGDDALNMSVAMPMPLVGKDSAGKEVFKLTIGQQKAHALYIPSIQATPKYSFSYQDVVLTMPDSDISAKLGSIGASMNLDIDSTGFYSGPSKLHAQNMVVEVKSEAEGSFFLEIGDIIADASYDGFDLAGSTKFQKEMGTANLEGMSEEEAAVFTSGIFKQVLQSANGMNTDMSIKNVSVRIDTPNDNDASFFFADAGFGFGLSGMRGEKSSIRLSGKLNGLDISGITPPFSDFVPSHVAYGMQVIDLPVQGLMSVLGGVLQPNARTATPDAREIKQMLSDAGTKYILESNDIDMPAFGSSLSGEVKANSAAVFGLTAMFTGRIRNLDELIAKYTPQLPELPPAFQQMYMPLTLALQVGKLETDEKTGQSVRVFEIEATPAGSVTINGQDAMMLVMGGMNGAQQQPMQQSAP